MKELNEGWQSDRKIAEIVLADRVKAFDRLVDMALDGWQGITVAQAIEAFKQEEGIYEVQAKETA